MIRNFTQITCLLILLGAGSSCASLTTWNGTHEGVKYTIHKDQRDHRIERGKNGRLLYDSPELTVTSENGQLRVNGQLAGAVKTGDHVEVTELGTVLVNNERRGDKMTGRQEMQRRITASKQWAQNHPPED